MKPGVLYRASIALFDGSEAYVVCDNKDGAVILLWEQVAQRNTVGDVWVDEYLLQMRRALPV